MLGAGISPKIPWTASPIASSFASYPKRQVSSTPTGSFVSGVRPAGIVRQGTPALDEGSVFLLNAFRVETYLPLSSTVLSYPIGRAGKQVVGIIKQSIAFVSKYSL